MKYTLPLLLFILLSISAFAQQQEQTDPALQRILQNLKKYQDNYPQEKVYLHMDKPYYTAGEDIWFKAYVTVSQFNFLSAISKLLYVELINDDDEIIQSRRLPIMAGLSIGDFKLPDTLREGSYRVRAYTNWMRNFDEGLFFDKTFVIGNSLMGGMVTASKITYQHDDKQKQIIHAAIRISDLKGNPIKGNRVNYSVKWNNREIAKGKAQLSEQGEFDFEFTPRDGSSEPKGSITLTIDNADKPTIIKVIPILIENKSPTFQLYPEAGVLLAGSFNKVAFRAVGTSGTGAEVTGYIESDGQKMVSFKSDHFGIGNFSFVPEIGKSYKAIADFGNGKTVETKLSEVTSSGYTMAVNNAIDNAVWIQVAAGKSVDNDKPLFLVVQHNGEVFYAVRSKLKDSSTTVNIPRKSLPSGIIKLLLLDEKANLVAERSIFSLNSTDLLTLQINSDKKKYGPREKVDLTFSAAGLNDSLRLGSFSMAVTNMTKVPDSAQATSNIISTLLLSSGIKKYIEDPGYYFQDNTGRPGSNRQLDDLMLTEGVDSVFWTQIKETTFPSLAYSAEKEISISGLITKRKEPVNKAKVTVISPQNILAVLDTVTGPDGRFSFDNVLFYDSTQFVVQARDTKGKKNVEITMDKVPQQKVSPNKNLPDVVADANQFLGTYLTSSDRNLQELQKFGILQRSIQLDEVEVTAKKESPAKHSSNLNGPGNADQVISGDDPFFGSCSSLDICLNGRLTGVIFKNGVPYSTRSQNQPMQIVMDGMYMDAEALSTIQPMDVASVEVLRSIGNTAIYGSYGAGGVLVITTRRGDQPRKYRTDLFTPGITTFSPQGLYQARTFSAPDYSLGEEKPGMKDLRTTIYWNPSLVTDKNGKATASFYTADEPGVYQIVIEGMDTEGHLGRSIGYIKVE